jgi:hypothetical protein
MSCSLVQSIVTKVELAYKVSPGNGRDIVDENLKKSRYFITTKQTPSATAVSHAGYPTAKKIASTLSDSGFTLLRQPTRSKTSDGWEYVKSDSRATHDEALSSINTHLTSVYGDNDDLTDDEYDGHHIYDDAATANILEKDAATEYDKFRYRIEGDSWFDAMASLNYAAETKKRIPKITVWPGDGLRIQDKIPKRLFGNKLVGSGKPDGTIRFTQIKDPSIALEFLYKHMFWGRYLRTLCNSTGPLRSWACNLRKRINAFIRGKADPLWSKKEEIALYGPSGKPLGKVQERLKALICVLKTVNGMFSQRFLAIPQERWTYEKYDTFVLYGVEHLISDYFIDGVLHEDAELPDSFFSSLKTTRGKFKAWGTDGASNPTARQRSLEIDPWLAYFHNVQTHVKSMPIERYTFSVDIMSQTRGATHPPPCDVLKSKVEALRTFTSVPAELTNAEYHLIQSTVDSWIKSLPQEIFTGLATKAILSITGSGCIENGRATGGTIEAIRVLLNGKGDKIAIRTRDLDTGKPNGILPPNSSLGTKVFWLALDHLCRLPPEERRKAFLVVIKEPGKARSITKTSASVKIVLDVIHRLCAAPLHKVPSSISGMGKGNHAWEFFKSFFTEELEDVVFDTHTKSTETIGTHQLTTEEYLPVYCLSTDYETATDYMHHTIAYILSETWMSRCGIPIFLRRIVSDTCYKPRKVYFNGVGPLKKIGTFEPETGLRWILLRRGILMGDPLTKIVLHILNACVRHFADSGEDPSLYDSFARFPRELAMRMGSGKTPDSHTL